MITAIRLTNFMAHKDSEIVLGPGVTALTGPNNTGKSAVVEALRCVAANPPPKHVLRHGTKEARVEVELDDGTRIVWVRTKTATHYELFEPGRDEPEEPFRKLGKNTVPPEISDLLRLDQVAIEGSPSVDVHIGDQKQPLFLIDDSSGSRTAKFFASSTEAAHLLAMQKLLKKKETDARREESRLTAHMAEVGRDLDRLQGLPAIEARAEAAQATETALQTLSRQLPALEGVLTRRQVLTRRLGGVADRTQALKPLVAVGQPYDALKLSNVKARLQQLSVARDRVGAKAEGYGALAEPPVTFPTPSLQVRLDERKKLLGRIGVLQKKLWSIAKLQPSPTLSDLEPLTGLVADIRSVTGRMAKGGQILAVLKERIAAKHAEVEKRAAEVMVCPLCGGDLDAERLLESKGGEA